MFKTLGSITRRKIINVNLGIFDLTPRERFGDSFYQGESEYRIRHRRKKWEGDKEMFKEVEQMKE